MKKSNFTKIILKGCIAVLICIFSVGCTESSNNNQNTAESTKKLSAEYIELNEKLNLSNSTLEDTLTTVKDENIYKLVPFTKSEEDFEFWKQLFMNEDEKYMSTYFITERPGTDEEAKSDFDYYVGGMWDYYKPEFLMFKATLNGENAGFMRISYLNSSKSVYFSYVTLEKFKGRGVSKNGVKMILDLLKLLKNKGYYKTEDAYIMAYPHNIASINIAEKNGFVFIEDASHDEYGRNRYGQKI